MPSRRVAATWAHTGPGRGTRTRCPRSTPSSAKATIPGPAVPTAAHHEAAEAAARSANPSVVPPPAPGVPSPVPTVTTPPRCRPLRGNRGARAGSTGRSWSRLEEMARARAATVVLMCPDPTGRFPCCHARIGAGVPEMPRPMPGHYRTYVRSSTGDWSPDGPGRPLLRGECQVGQVRSDCGAKRGSARSSPNSDLPTVQMPRSEGQDSRVLPYRLSRQ